MKRIALLSLLALLPLAGCVTSGKYNSAVAESQGLQNKVSAYESELAALRASDAAKAKESQDKIDGLQKQLKDVSEQLAALKKGQGDLEKEQKDLKKMNDLLKSDNERLEKLLQERKAEYGKAVTKLKAVVSEMGALDEPGPAPK